MLITTGP